MPSTVSWFPLSPRVFHILHFIVYKTQSQLPQLSMGRVKTDSDKPSTGRETEIQSGEWMIQGLP